MVRNILILGAGKSSIALVDYLVEHSATEQWQITVADISVESALQKTGGRENTRAIGIELNDAETTKSIIAEADIVISMLPPTLHLAIAKYCLALKKNLVTPSYISAEMKELEPEVERNGLIFMNEMGLDPGIDHMSAMQILDRLRSEGKTIIGFESHCGGLVAPESDDNPWHYKFTWNPRNVVLAGQGAGKIRYLKNGSLKELNYEELFSSATEIEVEGHDKFESYPNRDSLKYVEEYGLAGVQTMYRGTLRKAPFCKGWNFLVQSEFTDDKTTLNNLNKLSYKRYFEQKSGAAFKAADKTIRDLVNWVFDDDKNIPFNSATPARILQSLLEEKWKMNSGDKDMVVMVHRVTFRDSHITKTFQSSFVYTGKDSAHTAMAITVGLPVGIVTKMILDGAVTKKGVLMPKYPEVYNPVLNELKKYNIYFNEKEVQ